MDSATLLRQYDLRQTAPRRLVLEALSCLGKPVAAGELHTWIVRNGGSVNLVTVYRTLELFEEKGITHRHPSSGNVTLCALPNEHGHHGTVTGTVTCHGFLSCRSCGKVEEFSDPELCRQENRIAKNAGFRVAEHLTEILGTCSSCIQMRRT